MNTKLLKSYILGRTGGFAVPASPWVAKFADSSVSVSSGMSNEDDPTVRSANTQVKWDDYLVRLLIESYKELKHLLKKGKVTKKDFLTKLLVISTKLLLFKLLGSNVNENAMVKIRAEVQRRGG